VVAYWISAILGPSGTLRRLNPRRDQMQIAPGNLPLRLAFTRVGFRFAERLTHRSWSAWMLPSSIRRRSCSGEESISSIWLALRTTQSGTRSCTGVQTPDTMRNVEMRKRRSEGLPKTCRRAEDALPYSTLE